MRLAALLVAGLLALAAPAHANSWATAAAFGQETDAARRTTLAREYWTRFQQTLPMVPLHQEPPIFAVRETVADFTLRVAEDLELRQVRMRR